jgi:5-methylcytosine-specific restriction endonuclease McrA
MIIEKRERKKRSRVWIIPTEEMTSVVESCKNFSELLRKLELPTGGATRASLKLRLKKDSISTGHFITDNTGRHFDYSMTVEECMKVIFVKNSTASPNRVKRYIRKYGLIKYDVCRCGQPNVWNGIPLTMQLDHKDGNNKNNLMSNLQFLCPNCHTQTLTFSGRNRKF